MSKILIRKATERGHFDHGWLKTYHSFSFGEYFDPEQMGFGHLRVINEDWVAGGEGFPTHGHRDMEILTYVIEGALEHRDSTGSHGVIRPGEVQKMSAGSGIRHSEFNALKTESTHLYQIWLLPRENGIKPKYEQVDFTATLNSGSPVLLAAPPEGGAPIEVHQNVEVWAKRWTPQEKPGARWDFKSTPGALLWVQAVKGQIKVGETILTAGDGVGILESKGATLEAKSGAEALLFKMWK